jgi:deoxyribonuclease V
MESPTLSEAAPALGAIALVDVHYHAEGARAACVLAEQWTDPTPCAEWTVEIASVAPYRPGHFFERELPCLVQVLARAPRPPRVIVVDGYVVLDAAGTLGLGGHLFAHFQGQIPIIGLAKRSFARSAFATRLLRGSSRSPLFVTALGVPVQDASALISGMHGDHRIPTLCTRVDQLCRGLR